MAYETGTATSPGDLLVKLFDFAGANGWTIDDDIASDTKTLKWGTIHKNNVYATFEFNTSLIHLYPSRGFTSAATTPGANPNSAFGNNGTSEVDGIHCAGMTGPLTAYYFFEDEVYLHVVVDIDGDHFRHFGFGESIKAGNWTGGEYYYGCMWLPTGSTSADVPLSDFNAGPFNGYTDNTTSPRGGMMIYGTQVGGTELPGASEVGSKWGYVNSYFSGTMTDDIDGVQHNRFVNLSNIKGGFTGRILGTGVSAHNGFVPLVPMNYGLVDISTSPDNVYFLGTYPDVRACNMGALTQGGEYVIDTDTWVTFPVVRMDQAGTSDQWSNKYGIAYKKVIT